MYTTDLLVRAPMSMPFSEESHDLNNINMAGICLLLAVTYNYPLSITSYCVSHIITHYL